MTCLFKIWIPQTIRDHCIKYKGIRASFCIASLNIWHNILRLVSYARNLLWVPGRILSDVPLTLHPFHMEIRSWFTFTCTCMVNKTKAENLHHLRPSRTNHYKEWVTLQNTHTLLASLLLLFSLSLQCDSALTQILKAYITALYPIKSLYPMKTIGSCKTIACLCSEGYRQGTRLLYCNLHMSKYCYHWAIQRESFKFLLGCSSFLQ